MSDRYTQSVSVGLGGCHGPLRGARPCHRAVRQHSRLHPYRKASVCSPSPLRLACNADLANGNGNGHTSTLPKSLNGMLQDSNASKQPVVQELLGQVANGSVAAQDVAQQVRELGASSQKISELSDEAAWGESLSRDGIVWAVGKTPTQVAISLQRFAQDFGAAMAARVTPEIAEEVGALLPDAKYSSLARALTLTPQGGKKQERLPGTVAIVTDGSAEDATVEEARLATMAMGCYAYKLGGSSGGDGLSSLLPNLAAVQSAAVVIVVPRGEVALPAAVAALTQAPVVAVPSAEGLVSASPGVSVVARDNGAAAAAFAARILRAAARLRGASQA